MHVLIMSESSWQRHTFGEIIEGAGCTLSIAEAGDAAIAQVVQARPDIVVLTGYLAMNGSEQLLEWLHSDDGPRPIPHIIAHHDARMPVALDAADVIISGMATMNRIADALRPFLDSDLAARLDDYVARQTSLRRT